MHICICTLDDGSKRASVSVIKIEHFVLNVSECMIGEVQ